VFELDMGGFGTGMMGFLGNSLLKPLIGDFALRAARPGQPDAPR
jgi:hypothetical protein